VSDFDEQSDYLRELSDAMGRGVIHCRPGDVATLAIETDAGLLEFVDPGDDVPLDIWLNGQPILLGGGRAL
jgi:hypothetical protein